MSETKIKFTPKMAEVANEYLGKEFIPQGGATVFAGTKDNAEVGLTTYDTGYNYEYRYLDGKGRISTFNGERNWWCRKNGIFSSEKCYTETDRHPPEFETIDDLRSRVFIAELFGIWELDRTFIEENRQAIDDLHSQLFPVEGTTEGAAVHSAPPLLWAGITAPIVGAMMAALPACDDKKKADADKLAADGWDLYSKSENKAAAEKYDAAADIYYKCGLFAEEAKARNWFRECMLSTNTVGPEDRKVIYTKERDAFKRAAESEKDISQKVRHLWGAGEAGMRIGRDEVKAAIAFYDEAFKLSLSLKESKYEYAADTRHRQASALSRAAAESQMPELAKLSETADREAAELTVLKTENHHPAANLMKSQGPILVRSGLYKEALNAFINAARLFGSADEPSEAQEMSMSVADVRYWAIFGKGPEDELTAEWAMQSAAQNEKDKRIPIAIGLLRIAASIHESQENPTGAENVLKKAVSFPVEYQLAILNNYLSDADTFLRGGKLLDAITECNEGLVWAVRVKNNLGTSVKLEAVGKTLEAKRKAVMEAIDARWK